MLATFGPDGWSPAGMDCLTAAIESLHQTLAQRRCIQTASGVPALALFLFLFLVNERLQPWGG